jgi:hypothetical protein
MAMSHEPLDDLGRLWEGLSENVARGYSPIYRRVGHAVARDPDLLDLVREAPRRAHDPLILLGAVHYLLLGGLRHPLADVYAGRSDADPAPLFRDVCLSHRTDVSAVMAARRVQTNEVGRCALIGPALRWAADRFGEPVELVDVGTSAGLNLLCDRYLLDYGEHGVTGPPDATVRIPCNVMSGRPPIRARFPVLGSRIGIDVAPLDLCNPDDARWLLACVWPDTGRLDRARRAIELARRDPPVVVPGDALDALPGVLGQLGPGLACVLTTWFLAFLAPEQRTRFVEILSEAGTHRTVVWIACEGPGIVDLVDPGVAPDYGHGGAHVMTAVTFDSAGTGPTFLGFVAPHGAWIDWRA